MAGIIKINLRSILARFLQAEPLHNPKNSYELKETLKFCETELRYLGTGSTHLPPWSLPFQILPVPNNWRGHRTAEVIAALVTAIVDREFGIKRDLFESDELTLFEILWASVEHAGYMDEWRTKGGFIVIAYSSANNGYVPHGERKPTGWRGNDIRQKIGRCDNRNVAA